MKSLLKLSLSVGSLSIPIQTLLAQEPTAYTRTGNTPGPVFWIIYAAVLLFMLIAMWKVFTKAGQPGWAILIPFSTSMSCAKSEVARVGGSFSA